MIFLIKQCVAPLVGRNPAGFWSAAKLQSLLLTLTLMVAALGVSSAAMAAEMVKDPTTGKMVKAPEHGGTLTFAVKLEPPSADPLFGSGASRGPDGVTEKLGIVNWGIDRSVNDLTSASFYLPLSILTGRLAESWETPDATTMVLNIRQGVHWHDKAPMNGRELTADDVVYNFHRMTGSGSGFTEPPGGYSGTIATLPFASITATDKYTVVMKLKQPTVGALSSILTDWAVHIMPPEVIKQHGDVKDWRNLVGTGPLGAFPFSRSSFQEGEMRICHPFQQVPSSGFIKCP